jgi:hypothetical protein
MTDISSIGCLMRPVNAGLLDFPHFVPQMVGDSYGKWWLGALGSQPPFSIRIGDLTKVKSP